MLHKDVKKRIQLRVSTMNEALGKVCRVQGG